MNHDDTKCPFCYPVAGEFADSRQFRAICNVAPILPGHSLVVPKRHVESLMDLIDDELAEFMVFGRRVARILGHAFGTPAFNWTIQEREAAGQTVAHLHMHVIPRVSGDLPSPGDWYHPRLRQAQAEAIDTVSRRRMCQGEIDAMVARLRRAARNLDAV